MAKLWHRWHYWHIPGMPYQAPTFKPAKRVLVHLNSISDQLSNNHFSNVLPCDGKMNLRSQGLVVSCRARVPGLNPNFANCFLYLSWRCWWNTECQPIQNCSVSAPSYKNNINFRWAVWGERHAQISLAATLPS